MGQKIHPTGFRLAVTRDWVSRWYAPSKAFAPTLHADVALRRYLKERLKHAAVSRIVIERPAKAAKITIHTARPGVVIGKKGEDIEKLRQEVSERLGIPAQVSIEEVRKPELDAQLVAESIANQLEKRIQFRRADQGDDLGATERGGDCPFGMVSRGSCAAAHVARRHRLRICGSAYHLWGDWRQGMDLQRGRAQS
jgi:small subunit ribosomal protein S3